MDFFESITPETTILTPNRRLCASIFNRFSQKQISKGKTCWPTLHIIPLYPSWLNQLWKNYSAQYIEENYLLLTSHQEQILWERILRDAPENEILLQISETAKLAKSAWETLKRWQVQLSDSSLKMTEDSRAFLNWANQFQTLCHKNKWLDQNSLTDLIIEKILEKSVKVPEHILLVGFTEIAPQYQHLFKICESVGSQIEYVETESKNIDTSVIGLSDNETEIRAMASWAKSLLNQSQVSVGINSELHTSNVSLDSKGLKSENLIQLNSIACIIPRLENFREQTKQIFSEVVGEGNFNISAGKSLASYPIIYDALKILNINPELISVNNLSQILRSPFIGEAERERYKRALLDIRFKNSNITTISFEQLIDPELKLNIMQSCPAFSHRLKDFILLHREQKNYLPISKWILIFMKLLTAMGWPGERSLNSHEYQVVQNSWLPLLNELTTYDDLVGALNYKTALHYLTLFASNTIFQPESPEAPVQILGLLEAAELPFEHAWIMGLDDTTWPSRPKPNPFIPLSLQKKLNMPNASADRELTYCRQLTKQLQYSSAHVIFSYPLLREENELRPSSLLKNFLHKESLELEKISSQANAIFSSKNLELLQDDMAPAITEVNEIKGGVSIFKMQAECPFKAFAELRLHAKKIEETTLGLRNLDRGNIVHKALELIWRELQDSTTLNMKSEHELHQIIRHCAEQALYSVIEISKNQKRYLTLELKRLEKLLWDWLQIEKNRSPFKVIAMEHEITATIGNITTHFRVDRIDELLQENEEAKQLIIDYKTGKNIDKKDWFGERLSEPQLPIYCLSNPDNTIGIAFAKINPDKMEMVGASKASLLSMKSISILANINQADATLWHEQIQIWQTNLIKLGNDFYQGQAKVDPKDINKSCRICSLQPFCRIHEVNSINEEYDYEP